jgi:hypothetical protein
MLVVEYYCITTLAAFLLAAIRARIANDRSAITKAISITRGGDRLKARNVK